MKKLCILAAAIFMLLISAGCADTENVGNKKSPAQTTSEKNNIAQEETVGEISGLGDTADAWEAQFGHPFAQGDTLKLYAAGTYEVVFEHGRAVTITLHSQDGSNPMNDKILPRDGENQSENKQETGSLTMYVEKWHSAALQRALPDTKGMYTIMKNMDGETYVSIIIDCTPNLKK